MPDVKAPATVVTTNGWFVYAPRMSDCTSSDQINMFNAGALKLLVATLVVAASTVAVRADGNAQTLLKNEDLDRTAFAEWSAGGERPVEMSKGEQSGAMWTRESRPDWRGVAFGDSATPG